jgi:F-type H+-transporting ATPase subunit epsilon
MSTIKLKILSPRGIEVRKFVNSVILPGKTGKFEILSGHIPVISQLKSGVISLKNDGGKFDIKIEDGFVKFNENECLITINKSLPAVEVKKVKNA